MRQLLLPARAVERCDPEIEKEKTEGACNDNPANANVTLKVMPVLANSSSASHNCQDSEQKACDLKPENVSDSASMSDGDVARAVERAHPTIFSGTAPGHTKQSTSLGTKVTGRDLFFVALHHGLS